MKKIRVAIFGYGAVAAIHACELASEEGVHLTGVFGPNRERAVSFAAQYGIEHPTTDIEEACAMTDAVVVCSPSKMHTTQALHAITLGLNVLVELPSCEHQADAEMLMRVAEERKVVLQCAHTSRYLEPYRLLGTYLLDGKLGPIQHVNYIRHFQLQERSWADDALAHHAAHPLDLFLHWFGEITPVSCVAMPHDREIQDLSLQAKLPAGAPVSVSISYTSDVQQLQMTVVGLSHTVTTDGFSYLRSGSAALTFDGASQDVYERAIHDQDVAFLHACRGESSGIAWRETMRLTRVVDQFRSLAEKGANHG